MKHFFILVTVWILFLLLISCSTEEKSTLPWYLDTPQLWKDYHSAVEDTRTAEADEICCTLPAITVPGDNSRIEWTSADGRDLVLVGSMMNATSAAAWTASITSLPGEGLSWVTLPYDLEAHLRLLPACADSLECRMRMIQLLGLPPDCDYDRIVFFYADCDRLFRPTPDPEIVDDCASLDFPVDVPRHYREWFAANTAFSYDSPTPYPWTRLGYTYDWNGETASVRGPAEFVVHSGALVRLKCRVGVWTWYKNEVLIKQRSR